jgi:hypothetical protein
MNTTSTKKLKWFILVMVFMLIMLISALSSDDENPSPITTQVDQEIIVDIPALFRMNTEEAQQVLGEGTTYENIDEIEWETDEYYISATLEDDEIKTLFFSYDKPDASQETVIAAGNINTNDESYVIKIQEWMNPALAEEQNEAEIAGIHLCLDPQNTWCN